MASSETAKVKAKVHIVLEDSVDADGVEGMIVDIHVDPPILEDEEPSPAQVWAMAIVEMIYDHSKEVIVKDPELKDEFPALKGDKDGSDGLH
jgi:hypothetical protein